MSLYEAWVNLFTAKKLVPQTQGTCGVYSFWYAAMLLREIDPKDHPEVHPRKLGNQKIESIRSYTKTAFQSGQGEILTVAEMVDVIQHFKYKCSVCGDTSEAGKKKFISRSIAKDQPVMVPYWKYLNGSGGGAPTTVEQGAVSGAHWSLIIMEDDENYLYLDPHYPTNWQKFLKKVLLDANAVVDTKVFDRFWKKTGKGALGLVGNTLPHPIGNYPTTGVGKIYDVAAPGRPAQALNNVLVAIQ
jgi:hypothetical protein